MILRTILLALLVISYANIAVGQEGGTEADKSKIQAAVDGYLEAINRGDGAAAADFWSESGQMVNPDGSRVKGKSAIQKELESILEENKGQQVEVSDVSIRFLAPTVAVEEGKARVINANSEPSNSRYMAIHVKKDGQWKLDSLREKEIETPVSNHTHLTELEWMIGRWVDQDGESKVETTCQWTKNRNFMTRSFTVTFQGETEMEGTQIIGWDPNREQIRSWVFDSDGGYGQGRWTRSGDSWTVDVEFQAIDGRIGSSTNTFAYVDENKFNWQSTNRMMGDESLPDVPSVTIIRTDK